MGRGFFRVNLEDWERFLGFRRFGWGGFLGVIKFSVLCVGREIEVVGWFCFRFYSGLV